MNNKNLLKNTGTFLFFGGPALVAFAAVVLIPFLYGLYLTFTNWSVATGENTFVALSNYVKVLEDEAFRTSLWFTIKYAFYCLLF